MNKQNQNPWISPKNMSLSYAICENSIETLQSLIDSGADVDSVDDLGTLPLLFATVV